MRHGLKYKYWYRLGGHPDGRRGDPVFRQDPETGFVVPAEAADDETPELEVTGDEVHRLGVSEPWFAIRTLVFTTALHPFGAELAPWYEIRSSPPSRGRAS